MITLFAVPKPMQGEFIRLQENAVGSWCALGPKVEIILIGDETGVGTLASKYGARTISVVARTEFGTPRVDDIFRIGEAEARYDMVCYINADILLGPDFLESLKSVAGLKRRFLMVGRRWDLDFNRQVDFQNPDWAIDIRKQAQEHGVLHAESGIDYFLFHRGFWDEIPAFGIGRTMWDNWLIWRARASGAIVIDASDSIFAIHQNHGYNHHPQGSTGVWKGPEAARNEALAGGLDRYFTIADATHRLVNGQLQRWTDGPHVRRYWKTLPAVWKPAGIWMGMRKGFNHQIYDLRVKIARARGRLK